MDVKTGPEANTVRAKKAQRKGKVGQSQWFALCRQCGIPDAESARRKDGVLPGVHCEVKFRNVVDVPGALAQAVEDAQADQIPIVAWRKTHQRGWSVTMRARDMAFMFVHGMLRNVWVPVTMSGEEWLKKVYIPWARDVGFLPKETIDENLRNSD